MYYIYS